MRTASLNGIADENIKTDRVYWPSVTREALGFTGRVQAEVR